MYWQPFPVTSFNRYPFYSNVYDLLTYAQAQFNDTTFIYPETLDSMQNDYVLQFNIFKEGLGIINYEFVWSSFNPGDDFWRHLGNGIFGHGSSMAHSDTDHLSIVVLTNVGPSASPYGHEPHFDMTKAIGNYFWGL